MKRSPTIAATTFLAPATCVVVLLLVAPLCLLGRYSLNKYDPTELMIEALTPANYLRFFTEAFYYQVMRTTIVVARLWSPRSASCSASPSPIVSLAPTAAGRPPGCWLIILPLFIGSTVRTVGWMILFAQRGVMDTAAQSLFGSRIDLMYTPTAVVVGTLSVNLPFMVLTLQSVFEGIDTLLEEAAQGLGAAPARAFWRIVWPLALPGVSASPPSCPSSWA